MTINLADATATNVQIRGFSAIFPLQVKVQAGNVSHNTETKGLRGAMWRAIRPE